MDLTFKPIDFDDILILPRFFTLRPNKTNDSTFLNTFLWKDYYHVQYCILENQAVLWLMETEGEAQTGVPLCAAENLQKYFQIIKEYMNEVLHKKLIIAAADEGAVELLQLDSREFNVTEVPEFFDYLYDADKLRSLSGKRYHKKKNHVNAFLKEYEGRYRYRSLYCRDENEIMQFLTKWKSQKQDDVGQHLQVEYNGVRNLLHYCECLNLEMAGIFIDDVMEAFTMGSYNREEEMAIIHTEKANPEIRGLYPFINQQFAIHGFPKAWLINREDDMGLPGLRKAKESYYPIEMVRKYRIEQR